MVRMAKNDLLTTEVVSRFLFERYEKDELVTSKDLEKFKDSKQSQAEFEKNLLINGTAYRKTYAGENYWFPITISLKLGEMGLETKVKNVLSLQKQRNAEKELAQVKAAKLEFLKNRKTIALELLGKCSCGNLIPLGNSVLYSIGSKDYALGGLVANVGSVTCQRCSKHGYWGAFSCETPSVKFMSNDKTLVTASNLGYEVEEIIPRKQLNELFTRHWQAWGEKGEFCFRGIN